MENETTADNTTASVQEERYPKAKNKIPALLTSMESMISYYETSTKSGNGGVMRGIDLSIFDKDMKATQKRLPKFDPGVDYRSALYKEVRANDLLQFILGEALTQLEEIEQDYSRVDKLKQKAELRCNPRWKRRRKNFELNKNFHVKKIHVFFLFN